MFHLKEIFHRFLLKFLLKFIRSILKINIKNYNKINNFIKKKNWFSKSTFR